MKTNLEKFSLAILSFFKEAIIFPAKLKPFDLIALLFNKKMVIEKFIGNL